MCVEHTHYSPPLPHRHLSAYMCLAALALCVCTRFRMCVPGEHACAECMHVYSSVSGCGVCVCICMQFNTWGEGVSVCGVHTCLWNVFMACIRVCMYGLALEALVGF